jgi:hypothetical protein
MFFSFQFRIYLSNISGTHLHTGIIVCLTSKFFLQCDLTNHDLHSQKNYIYNNYTLEDLKWDINLMFRFYIYN